jgi:hypothetical protein
MRGEGLLDERSLSACLFGNRHRLELLVALAEASDGRVNLGALAAERGVQAAVYYGPMRDLLAMRLAVRVELVPGDRRRWYRRAGGDRVWEAVAVFAAGLRGHLAAITGSGGGGVGGR